jgi:hypothetical protein
VQRSGGVVTGIAPGGATTIDGLRHVLSLVEVPEGPPAQRRVWAFGFTGPTFTQLPFIPGTEIQPAPPLSDYATAMRADFAPGAASAAAVPLAAHAGQPAALPLSVIYRPGSDPPFTSGDTNCDGQVNFFDIDPFLMALFNPSGYAAAYPACSLLTADCNGDANVNFFDIDPFLDCLFNGCP